MSIELSQIRWLILAWLAILVALIIYACILRRRSKRNTPPQS